MSWTDAATIVSGFATPVAIVGGLGTWLVQRGEEALAGARLVTAQLAADENGWRISDGEIVVDVRNDSPGPISQVWVKVPGTDGLEHRISVILPGQSDIASAHTTNQRWAISNVGCGGPTAPTQPAIDLRFVDHRGKKWARHGYDKPTRSRVRPDRPTPPTAVG